MRNGRLASTGRWLTAGLLAAALGAGTCLAAAARPADVVEVQKIVLADRDLKIGQDQLVQVSLRNMTTRATQAGIHIELRDEKDNRVGAAQNRKVALAPLDEDREFFTFQVPRRQGKFTIKMELYKPDFREKLLAGDPVFYSPFTVLGGPEAPPPAPESSQASAAVMPEGGKPTAKRPAPPNFSPPAGLHFERPDMLWENVNVKPMSLLVGEPLHITADLRNVGGDIARNVDVLVEYFNTKSPGRKFPITRSSVLVVAPGEKVEMEFETKLPEDAPLGDYKVELSIDPGNKLDESNKENNTTIIETPVRLSLIKQVFPDAGFVFEDAGLFLFRWDSHRFDEYKVQVGTDPSFSDENTYFDLPQGDKWTKSTEIVPLPGEMPDMAQGLMKRMKADHLYWRVMGRTTDGGRTGVSQALPFRINIPESSESSKSEGGANASMPQNPPPAQTIPPAQPASGPAVRQ